VLFPLARQTNGLPRVVVTGAGIITSLGDGWTENASGFRSGRTAFRPVTLFDVSRQRVKTAGEVTLPAELPAMRLSERTRVRVDRASKLLLHAGHQAWTQAGWEPGEVLPLVLGTTGGGMSLGEAVYRQAITEPHSRRGQPTRVAHYQPQRQAMDLAEGLGFSGSITIIANACASGANAIGHAWEHLRRGHAQRALAGGYEALSQLIFSGFDSLQALSPTECRPFDAHRDGLSLGEGAGLVALETLESASRRQAVILGELVGYGAVTDDGRVQKCRCKS
jgi:3-oxoacyl-[acyl-carrier-protein] synthase II